MDTCRCCGAPMGPSDHCPVCGCERFEERPTCRRAAFGLSFAEVEELTTTLRTAFRDFMFRFGVRP